MKINNRSLITAVHIDSIAAKTTPAEAVVTAAKRTTTGTATLPNSSTMLKISNPNSPVVGTAVADNVIKRASVFRLIGEAAEARDNANAKVATRVTDGVVKRKGFWEMIAGAFDEKNKPAQTRRAGPAVRNLRAEFPAPTPNVTEAQMAEIKEYVSKLREKYNLSEKEVQDVTLALASHPGQSLKAEMEMLNRILATTDSFSDPASRTQAGHVLLQSYSQLTPARAFKPEHFPQGVVEALTRFGFEKGPGLGYKWGGEERLTEVARIIAVMDEKAYKILLPVMGTWEPKSGKAFEFIAEYPDSLPGVGNYTPESAASTIVSEVRR